jgi:lipoate-protein ligase A
MVINGKLLVWLDPVLRSGPEAMAVDECLLETAASPVLRVYAWAGDWVSIGYFGEIQRAQQVFPQAACVRRWTGGGMVDHRSDWTYSLVLPSCERLTAARGGESYRQIHAALALALVSEGIASSLSGGTGKTGDVLCFSNPVGHDLVAADGCKLAGAGQRRTRDGLLHQGSVALPCGSEASRQRAERLAEALAERWEPTELHPDPQQITAKILARYGADTWTARR